MLQLIYNDYHMQVVKLRHSRYIVNSSKSSTQLSVLVCHILAPTAMLRLSRKVEHPSYYVYSADKISLKPMLWLYLKLRLCIMTYKMPLIRTVTLIKHTYLFILFLWKNHNPYAKKCRVINLIYDRHDPR